MINKQKIMIEIITAHKIHHFPFIRIYIIIPSLQSRITHQHLNVMQTNQTFSITKNPLRRSAVSKFSGYSSILNTASPDENLEILRISLKKQLDRKQKLQRLMQKYQQINVQQKSHIKSIKSNIIQLKDLESNNKTRFYLNPVIYVDNRLSKDTREYLCMLLNTFYAKYDENTECEFKTKQLGRDMNELLESISKNEENLLKIEKETIGVQVQLQGELLGLKTKLKDETQRQKQLQEQQKRIGTICSQYQDNYKQQLQKVQKLRAHCQQLQDKICSLKQKVAQGEMVKKGKEEMMANEIAYQERFRIQLGSYDEEIVGEHGKANSLKIKIKQKKLQVEQLKVRYQKMCAQQHNVVPTHQNFIGQDLCLNSLYSPRQQNRTSLTQIKKYQGLVDSINQTLAMNRTTFGQGVKSKDSIDHEVGMRMVELKTQGSFLKRKEGMSVRG